MTSAVARLAGVLSCGISMHCVSHVLSYNYYHNYPPQYSPILNYKLSNNSNNSKEFKQQTSCTYFRESSLMLISILAARTDH